MKIDGSAPPVVGLPELHWPSFHGGFGDGFGPFGLILAAKFGFI
jgi:hypothetical protein